MDKEDIMFTISMVIFALCGIVLAVVVIPYFMTLFAEGVSAENALVWVYVIVGVVFAIDFAISTCKEGR